jgi:plastocyanin
MTYLSLQSNPETMKRRKFIGLTISAGVYSTAGCINKDTNNSNTETRNQENPENETINQTDGNKKYDPNDTSEDDPEPVVDDRFDAQVALDNVETNSWEVVSFNGPGQSQDQENPDLELRSGVRYRFSNFAGSNSHPIGFRSRSGEVLISESQTGTFQNDGYVNIQNGDDYIEFTLTEELEDKVYEYYCENHTSMAGRILV